MAEAENTVDPNDLDSIDALLDEAELETVEDDVEEVKASEAPDDDSGISVEETEEVVEDTSTDDLLDDLETDLAEVSEPDVPDATVVEEPEPPAPEPEPIIETAPEPEPMMAEPQPQMIEEPPPRFIQEREKAKKPNNELTVAEMDSIKKLIIIFSSVLITLALVGIGIGVWGALSSGGGLDEETMNQLSNIESGTTESLMKTNSNSKSVKSIEKKLDALSFQIEQLNADIVKLESQALGQAMAAAPTQPPVNTQKTPDQTSKSHGQAVPHQNSHQPPHSANAPVQVIPVQQQPVMPAQPMPIDPEVAMKIDKVSAQLSSAQRRILEVNKRVKSLQGQYKQLLKGMKKVEKQVVMSKVDEKKDKQKKLPKKAEQKPDMYQYNAPDGMYYDHQNVGSYP